MFIVADTLPIIVDCSFNFSGILLFLFLYILSPFLEIFTNLPVQQQEN